MADAGLIAGLVREAYGAEPATLDPLGNDPTGERMTYRVTLGDGRVWMLRGYRAGSHVPSWYGGGPSEEWLHGRALVLDWLERCGYPAPRIVPTRGGDPLARRDGYCVLALSYIPGEPLPSTPEHLERLAGALGRLHALDLRSPADGQLPPSWWYPLDRTTAPPLAQLAQVEDAVPPEWRPLHAAFTGALHALRRRDDLPLALIHGDCHPGNALVAEDGQVALVDWDCAGVGLALLDLGTLLLDAHPDPVPGEPIAVDPQLVAAVVASYRRHRALSEPERESLLDATRFGVAFVGSLRFVWAREQGWSERIERSLRRLRTRYEAAEDVARLASAEFSRGT